MITSTANAAVKTARRLARSRHARTEGFLVEGPQAVREALSALQRLFVTAAGAQRAPELVAAARHAGVEVLEVSDAVLASVACTVTPQGLVGVAVLPAPALDAALLGARTVVACDRLADPGNAGAIIRTADAGGADAVVLTGDAVDPTNPKAVRSSAGSLFHLPVVFGVSSADLLRAARRNGLAVVGTAVRGGTAPAALDLAAPTVLLLGSEAHGLGSDVLAACDAVVTIPMHARAASLNVAAAAAVLVFEAARQRALATAGDRT